MNQEILQAVKCAVCGKSYSLHHVALDKRFTLGWAWMQEHSFTKHNINLLEKRNTELMQDAFYRKNKVLN